MNRAARLQEGIAPLAAHGNKGLHLARKLLQRVWLLQIEHAMHGNTALQDHVVRVSGNVEQPGVGAQLQEPLGKFAAAHLGHYHVSDDQINASCSVEHLQRFQTTAGTSDCVDRKSTRLNSSHGYSSDAAFCLKKKQ